MSLLAGFDMVTEISNATIRKLIRKNMSIGGVPANPPFELTLPLSGGLIGRVHVVFDDLLLDLNSDDSLTLHLPFSLTSAMVTSPLSLTICPLSGTMHIKVPLVLSGGATQQVTANMAQATVTIAYTAQADQVITNSLAGLPVTPQTFKDKAKHTIAAFVKSVPNATMPMAFAVVPGADGSISPLQFSSLKIHCIGNADQNKQALGLFGNLLKATQGNGDVNQKTATAIAPGQDVSVSISPGAFHAVVFCPTAATALDVAVKDMPTSCGGAPWVHKEGVDVMFIGDSFANGHINIDGIVHKSGTRYDANGSFHGEITLSISGTSLTPSLNMGDPDVSIDIPWYCYLAIGVVLGPVATTIIFIVDQIIDGVLSKLAGSLISGVLGNGLGAVSLGGLSDASFQSVGITPEGLNLQGEVPVFVPGSSFFPSLVLDGSVTTGVKTPLSSGVWHTQLWCKQPKDYPYTEYGQNQTGTFDITSSMLDVPLHPTYQLRATNSPTVYPLTGTSGTITLENVKTTYALPLDTGGSEVTQDVPVDYEINGSMVKLKNHQKSGNFTVYLTAAVKDCAGQVPAVVSADPEGMLSVIVHFEGSWADIGGGYLDDYQECQALLQKMTDKISDNYKPYWQFIPIWVKVNYPAPEQIIEQIRMLVALGTPQAENLLMHTRVAHGASFSRAIHAPTSVQLGQKKATPRAIQARTQTLAIQQQIADLSAQLADVQVNAALTRPAIAGLKAGKR